MIFKLVKKILFRIFRLIKFRKRVFGIVGKKNRFLNGVFILELAHIGNNNYIGPYSMINNATIGNYCSIAPGVKIGQANHDITCISTYGKVCEGYNGFKMHNEPTVIGDNVWIAANAIILQGVKIGDGAVIGAGAIVNKNIPPYAIAVGVPAKVIKFRFDEQKIRQINENIDWKKDLNELKKDIYAIHDKWKIDI
jgi:Acetyltransferase (isoleucine patch superfamily)